VKWSVATGTAAPLVNTPYPTGVAFDASGNLYIVSQNDLVLWSVTNQTASLATSLVPYNGSWTVALNPQAMSSRKTSSWGLIQKWSPSTRTLTSVPAFNGSYYAWGFCIDSLDNIYVTDTWNNGMKKWSRERRMPSTVFPYAYAVCSAVDVSGDIYFTDYNSGNGGNEIRKWSARSNSISTFLSGENGIIEIIIDRAGTLYFDTYGTHLLKEKPRASLTGYR